jgi:hypothetical protein
MRYTLLLALITAACWYFALTKSSSRYARDWRLRPFHLSDKEEQEFHGGVRKVVALTCAIFFSVCLIISFVVALVRQ